jgi:signal peptidase II
MHSKKKSIIILLIISFIFIFDQISKILVVKHFEISNQAIILTDFLSLDLIRNDGIAFGLLGFENTSIYNLITIIISLIIIYVLYLIKTSNAIMAYFFAMITGGALGNLIDRILYKSVPDFIDFHYKDFHWFIFNVADIFISVGVFGLIVLEITQKKNAK